MSTDLDDKLDFSQLPPLPDGWAWSLPAEFCTTVASGSTPTADKLREGSGDIPFIKVNNLTHFGVLDFSARTAFIERETHVGPQKRSIAKPGDVLINIVGPPLGKVSLVPDTFPEWNINQAIVLFRPSTGISPRYLSHALLTDSVMRRLIRLAKATAGQLNVGVSMCRKLLPIPIAPAAEQNRICDALDEVLSDLDAGVVALERVRAKLARYRAAVLKAAVEGALTFEWRQQHPNLEPATELLTRILAERRHRWEQRQLRNFEEKGEGPPRNWKEKYKEPLPPDDGDLPRLPPDWCWATLGQIADIEGGVTKGQKFSAKDQTRVVPYLRVANVQRGFLNLCVLKEIRALESDINALRLMPGDVLFTEGGDRDKLGRGWVWEGQIPECIHQNHVFRGRLVLPEVQPRLVSWCGNSYGQLWFMKTGKQSVNLASINLTVLRSFPVPIPPAREQEAIVEAVEDHLSIIEHTENEINDKVAEAHSLRQSILRHAFTGQLVPQDPNDEPASELLKRIAAERDARTQGAAAEKPASRSPKRKTAKVP